MSCLDENVVVELLEGRASSSTRNAVDMHLADCPACRALVARLTSAHPEPDTAPMSKPRLHGPPRTPGTCVSRYVIERVVGVGGMGVVYAARDPELNRDVAVKLLRKLENGDADALRTRLVREARAMARLTHPNVVSVHDIGAVDGQVFIVMELVAGPTLSSWLGERDRTLREVLEVFRRAGEGLAAAHAVGLVHRDFKPDNVLIAGDDRVLVTDFGLARSAGIETPAPGSVSAEPTRLTQSGTLIGTPAYMSPEQLDGEEVTLRSDVFSFCVALYEAVYRQHPFAGSSMSEHKAAIATGQVREARRGVVVAAWLRALLVRGLSADPRQRFESMDELLAELAHDRTRTRRRVALAITALLLIVVAGLIGQRAQAARLLCRGADRKLAHLWNADRRRAIESALLASGKPFAGATWSALKSTLDDYGKQWRAMFTDTCEATRLRGEQSEEVMQLRMTCLSSRLDELGALTEILSQPDASSVATVTEAANSLSPIAPCADVQSLMAPVKPPRDPIAAAEVQSLRQEVARVHAQIDAGRYGAAQPRALELRVRAKQVGYAPLEAAALLDLGQVQLKLSDLRAAEETLIDAACAAESGHDDEAVAEAWVRLVSVVGYHQARTADGRRWARMAKAALRRLDGRRRDLEADLLDDESALSEREQKPAQSLAEAQLVLQLREQLFSADSLEVAQAHRHLGNALQMSYDNRGALEQFKQAQQILTRVLGPQHPSVAQAHFDVGAALNNLGRLNEAETEYRTAVTIAEAALGPNSLDVAWYLDGLSTLLAHTGHLPAALVFAMRVLAIREAALDGSHSDSLVSTSDVEETAGYTYTYGGKVYLLDQDPMSIPGGIPGALDIFVIGPPPANKQPIGDAPPPPQNISDGMSLYQALARPQLWPGRVDGGAAKAFSDALRQPHLKYPFVFTTLIGATEGVVLGGVSALETLGLTAPGVANIAPAAAPAAIDVPTALEAAKKGKDVLKLVSTTYGVYKGYLAGRRDAQQTRGGPVANATFGAVDASVGGFLAGGGIAASAGEDIISGGLKQGAISVVAYGIGYGLTYALTGP